jgi:hypothetical protein
MALANGSSPEIRNHLFICHLQHLAPEGAEQNSEIMPRQSRVEVQKWKHKLATGRELTNLLLTDWNRELLEE